MFRTFAMCRVPPSYLSGIITEGTPHFQILRISGTRPGDRPRETRELHNSILNSYANYQTLRDSISIGSRSSIEGTETTTPWSQLSEGVYARFITLSHYERPGVLQIRALKAGSIHPAELAADPDDKKIQPLGLAAVPIPLVAPHPLLLMAILAYAAAETAKNVDWNAVGKVLKDLESFANEISEDGKKLIDEMRHRWDKQRQSGLYRPPPKLGPNPDGYPGLEHAKPVGGRPRWRDGDGNIYDWDGRYGEIEKYDRQGRNHKGGFDPETGELRSPPDPRKRVPK